MADPKLFPGHRGGDGRTLNGPTPPPVLTIDPQDDLDMAHAQNEAMIGRVYGDEMATKRASQWWQQEPKEQQQSVINLRGAGAVRSRD